MNKRCAIGLLLLGVATQASASSKSDYRDIFSNYMANGYEYTDAQQRALSDVAAHWATNYSQHLTKLLNRGYELAHAQQLIATETPSQFPEIQRQLFAEHLAKGFNYSAAQQLAARDYHAIVNWFIAKYGYFPYLPQGTSGVNFQPPKKR